MTVLTILFYPSKSLAKMFPWTALTCLFFTYAVMGIFLADLLNGWLGWALAIAGLFLVTMLSTHPQFNTGQWFSKGLRSEVFAFTLLAGCAALVSIMLVWFHIFLKLIAILSAEALVKLELRHYGFSVVNLFWLMMTTSLAGLGLGWFVSNSI